MLAPRISSTVHLLLLLYAACIGSVSAQQSPTAHAVQRPSQPIVAPIIPVAADGDGLSSARITAPRDHSYTRMHCIGGRGRSDAFGDRSCRFQNICYRPSDDAWLHYTDPDEDDEPVTVDAAGELSSAIPQHLVNLRSVGNPADARYWAPQRVSKGPIPQAAFAARKEPSHADLHILYHPHYPSNIGHVIGDDLFPIYNLMSSFGVLTSDAQLIIQRDCDKIFSNNAKKAAQCHGFLPLLLPGVSRRQYLAATQDDLAERLGVDPALDLVCFENLLAGQGPWGFQQSLGRAPRWWGYHNFYLSNYGVNPLQTPKKPRITVSIKKGKRGLANNDELVAHLRAQFPKVEIDALELVSLGGWRNELRYLQDTSVLITPCGGVSMSAMFLPHNAALVVIDYFSTRVNNSVGMEERLWSNLGYIRAFHYPFSEAEVELPDHNPPLSRTEFQDMRDYGQVRVNLERMTDLVKAALSHTNNFMLMGQQ